MIIRPALLEDASEIAHVHIDSWREAFMQFMPEVARQRTLDYNARTEQWQSILSENADFVYVSVSATGAINGFAHGGLTREAMDGYSVELLHLYIAPTAQGQGIGQRLMEHVAQRLYTEGFASMLVTVYALNRPARSFYEKHGGELIRRFSAQHGGYEFWMVSYGWSDLYLMFAKDE